MTPLRATTGKRGFRTQVVVSEGDAANSDAQTVEFGRAGLISIS